MCYNNLLYNDFSKVIYHLKNTFQVIEYFGYD